MNEIITGAPGFVNGNQRQFVKLADDVDGRGVHVANAARVIAQAQALDEGITRARDEAHVS